MERALTPGFDDADEPRQPEPENNNDTLPAAIPGAPPEATPGAPPEATPDAIPGAPPADFSPAPFATNVPRAVHFTASPTWREYLACANSGSDIVRLRMGEVRLPAEDQACFNEYVEPLNLVAIVAAGMPETAAMLPVWVRIAEACPRADLRVIGDGDLRRLDLLLGDETQIDLETAELPTLLILDDEYLLQAQWGPRPQAAEALLDEWITQHPDLETLADSDEPRAQQTVAALLRDLTLQMRIWYNSGLDAQASAELRALLASLREEPAEPA